MYVIKDEGTGRFLSWRSFPSVSDIEYLYITYTGKVGTDFFTSQVSAKRTYDELQQRIKQLKDNVRIQISKIELDSLSLGETIIITKQLDFSKKAIIY